jgi:hypothetical protein
VPFDRRRAGDLIRDGRQQDRLELGSGRGLSSTRGDPFRGRIKSPSPPSQSGSVSTRAKHKADRVVAEINNGGEMVEATLRMVDPNVAFTAVRATRGKVVQAQPVAALYEQRRVHHVGSFPKLEDQMCGFTPDFDRAAGYSPDRVDALIWAFTDLLVEPMAGEGIFELYRQQAAKAAAEKAAAAKPKPGPPAPGSVEWSEMMKNRQPTVP